MPGERYLRNIGTLFSSQDAIGHDENFNSITKLAFENKLAWFLIHLPGKKIKEVVHKASIRVWTILGSHLRAGIYEEAKQFQKNVFKEFYHQLGFESYQLARLVLPADFTGDESAKKEEFVRQTESILNNPEGPLLTKFRINLAAYAAFFNHMSEAERAGSGNPCLQAEFTSLRDQLRGDYFKDRRRPRRDIEIMDFLREDNLETAAKLWTRQFGLFSQASRFDATPKEVIYHTRGTDIHWLGTKSNFLNAARYELDMPVVCGPSSTMVQSLILGLKLFQFSLEELNYYSLMQIAYNIAGGHHSFHECAIILPSVGLNYIPGDYLSIFPRGIITEIPVDSKTSLPWLLALKQQFSGIFSDVSYEVAAETLSA
ncbi:MAG: hypothetical protein A3E87_07510 [Gammaproteobacteria bacterium RIFCSPHIGHO2_12_FULL_35_23]|nr:MAG: hypothetical protein A3E87_07510 [Gammaproteobacteria bacterium RIFCSPHIGHO2_12_FULL_35_23]